jgi:DNA modification methylase
VRSFTIITTVPNGLCAELHNRMPVVLKPNAWPVWLGEEPANGKADLFIDAWRGAGFRIAGHLVFRKRYPSSTRFLRYQHEQAYRWQKATCNRPREFPYTGNKLHPTQKPLAALRPLIEAFCPAQGTVLDPFAGSGSALVAAKQLGRQYIGIELDEEHHRTATMRLEEAQPLAA